LSHNVGTTSDHHYLACTQGNVDYNLPGPYPGDEELAEIFQVENDPGHLSHNLRLYLIMI